MALTFPHTGTGWGEPEGPLLETVDERARRQSLRQRQSSRHLRLAEPDRVDVALVTEGTYPYARGGVSVWCDQVVSGLSELRFRIAALTAFGHQQPAYELPPHARELRTVGLWDGSLRYRPLGGRPVAPLARRLASLLTAMGDDVAAFRAFVDEAMTWSAAEVTRQLGFGELLRALDEELALTPRWWALDGVRVADVVQVADMLDHLLRTLTVDIGPAAVYHATSNGLAALACMVATRRHGGEFLLSEHGVYLRERYLELRRLALARPAKALLVRFHRLVTAAAYAEAAVTSPCSDWNQRWELRFGARPSRLRTVYNGIDPERFPVQEPGAAGPIVAWLGRIDPLKDLETLVRAFRVVCDKRPDARLRLFGLTPAGNEDYRADMESLVAELDLGEAVTFEGGVPHGSAAYADAQVCVLSSISEGFPYALIEGMACGLPSVATGVGGVSEAIDDGTGLVVLPRSPDLLGAALLELLDDPERCRRMGVRARERIEEHFTLDHCLAGYRALYQQLAEEADRVRTRGADSGDGGGGAGGRGAARGGGARGAGALDAAGAAGAAGAAEGVRTGGRRPARARLPRRAAGTLRARLGGRDGQYVVRGLTRAARDKADRQRVQGSPGADGANGSDGSGDSLDRRRPLTVEDYDTLVAAVGGLEALRAAVDVEEVTAALESVGVTDQVAVQSFSSHDVFDLAERVWAQTHHQPTARPDTPDRARTDDDDRPTRESEDDRLAPGDDRGAGAGDDQPDGDRANHGDAAGSDRRGPRDQAAGRDGAGRGAGRAAGGRGDAGDRRRSGGRRGSDGVGGGGEGAGNRRRSGDRAGGGNGGRGGGDGGGGRRDGEAQGGWEPPRPEPVLQSTRGALARGVAYVLPAVAVAAASLAGPAQPALMAASVLGWGLVQGGGMLAYTLLNRSPIGSGLRPLRQGIVRCVVAIGVAGLGVGLMVTPAAGAAFALPLLHLVASCALIMAGRTWLLLGLLTPTAALSLAALVRPDLDGTRLVAPAAAVTVAVLLLLVLRDVGGGETGPRPKRLQRADWFDALPMVICGWLSAGCAVLSVRALAHVDALSKMHDRVWLLLALPLWTMVVTGEWLLVRMRRSLRTLLHTTATVAAFRAESRWVVTSWLAAAGATLAATVIVAMVSADLPALAAWQAASVFLYVSLAFVGVIVLYTTPWIGPALLLQAATTLTLAAVVTTSSAPFGLPDHVLGLVTCAAAAVALCVTAASTLTDPASHR